MTKKELTDRIVIDLEENLHDSMDFIWRLVRQALCSWTKKELDAFVHQSGLK